MIDLHIHTNRSDGQYSPEEVVSICAERGVELMAITDHDTVAGIEQSQLAANERGIRFIPGIEISTRGEHEMHLLGYCINIHHDILVSLCRELMNNRIQRNDRICEYLNSKGVKISLEQVKELTTGEFVGRPHFARAMLDSGYVKSIEEAFDLYLATPEYKKIERPKPKTDESIGAIRKSGGVAVLAHPLQLNISDETLEALVKKLKEYGLGGIECYYSTHSAARTAYLAGLAKKYDLIATGGSDFHGEKIKPDIKIGTGINNSLCLNRTDIYDRLQEAAFKQRQGLS